jgi:hypothetical protein
MNVVSILLRLRALAQRQFRYSPAAAERASSKKKARLDYNPQAPADRSGQRAKPARGRK